MLSWLVNPAQRRLLVFFLLLLAVVAVFSLVLAEVGARQVMDDQIRQDIALVGFLAGADKSGIDPQKLVSLMDGRFGDADSERGRQILAGYGLTDLNVIDLLNRYRPIRLTFLAGVGSLAILVLLTAAGWTAWTLSRLHRQIRRIADLASEPVNPAGQGQLNRIAGREGDLAALAGALDKLRQQSDRRQRALAADKQYLQRFLSDISHQIKTPLASLRLDHDLMLEQPDMPENSRLAFLRQDLNQIDRIEWLVQGLLKMARLEAGAVSMQPRLSPLADTVRQAVSPFSEQIRQSRIRLDNKVPADLFLNHDPDWVAEAVSNLVKNALEHTPPGGEIRIEADRTPMSIQLRVIDNGQGLPTEEIPFIFERFYRHDAATRPNAVGIGLSLAKTILAQNGGDLSAASRPGQGATFTATFLTGTAGQ